ncbi:MAG: succinate--CoA ligase subunit alpha [Prolixibacteraceae bacterium]|jgi:succinyl-CoA synthetase alpha subunit|nr:succinate--CoA ligase subunit alpha [Prolixibacteraceae bacterium]MBT6765662.1 succinate--CoA ligase subunit alpha [Prolixibacteraceae bacterium]MBT6998469.1 succinate--CoA ligase subunit alpha [Prolixibacteraceae bacterium]MBT7397110.1 succinate--CoA ligase subunit alpha [Prolixibacteraceae bacterium]
MSILINKDTKLIVQGITGRDGAFHTSKMKTYGTNIVGGISPGKGGIEVDGIPVFNTVEEAVKATGANASVIFVPAPFAGDAIMEASFAGVELVICITEGVPVQDMIKVTPVLKQNGTKMIGANCPGLITVDECLIGILPGMIFKKGNVGLISRSGTLTYEVVDMLTQSGLGQTTCVGIGGDSVSGLYFKDLLEMYENDPETEAVVLIGEIGGDAEEQAAQYIKDNMTKPVVAFIAGQSAPPGKRMGHAGAIISSGAGTAEEKIKAFAAAGVPVAKEPGEIPGLVKEKLGL